VKRQDILIAVAMGVGATLVMDLWNLFLARAFGIRSLDYGLLGRWLLHMPEGTFRHASIAKTPAKSFERPAGWLAHYTIGVVFAVVFVALMPASWTAKPTLAPALVWGIITVVFPYFLLQPALGLGVAASRTPRPAAARLKSLATHIVFGIGLYLCALLIARAAFAAESEVQRDVAYGPDAKQRLDLSVPDAKGFPTVVFVHGGSLTSGDKEDEDYGAVCRRFPAAGIACASVNYRLAPAHAWPAQAEDVAAALAWVRANIGARGGDPARLYLVGHSSGAMLVALAGTDKPAGVRGVVPMGSIMYDEELEQAIEKHGRERVAAAFVKDPDNAMYGSLDAYLDHWPIRRVQAGMPPYLFLVAEEEREHPPVLKTNEAFVERAVALGNRAECRVLSGRNHYGAIRKLAEPGDPVFAIIRDFVRAGATAAP